jgi:hypothetical protein
MRMPWVVLIVCLLALAGCPSSHAPLVPLLFVPDIAQRGDSVRATIFCYDKDADSLYFFVEWGDGTKSDWVGPAPSASDNYLYHTYGDTGVFAVLAKAKDETHETGWSDTSFIRIGEYGPYVPHRPAGPETVSVGDSANYVTAAGHPLNRRVAIQFDWGDTLGEWGEYTRPNVFVTVRHAFSLAGTMLVRARARDTLAHVSDWSKPETVLVVE